MRFMCRARRAGMERVWRWVVRWAERLGQGIVGMLCVF